MDVVAYSDLGLLRKRNEDAALIGSDIIQNQREAYPVLYQGDFQWLAVADGLGGHARGDLASRSLLGFLASDQQPFREKKDLNELATYLSGRMKDAAQDEPGASEMATTVTAIYCADGKTYLIHCGDCRAYSIGKKKIPTNDHTLVFENYSRGLLTLEQLRSHPLKSRLLRCVDAGWKIPEFDLRVLTFEGPERLLLATDGIWESLPHEELMERSEGNIKEAASRLVDGYRKSGAQDNGTFLLIDF